MPALAFATASLYHVRRWLESEPDRPDWWQFGIGSALGGLAVLTYFQAAVVVPVALAWVVVEGRWRLLTISVAGA